MIIKTEIFRHVCETVIENVSVDPLFIRWFMGSIPGELSFAANSGELERTPREFAIGSPTPTLRRTFAGVRRTFAERSPEFGGVRPQSAANWRTVRQKIRSREEITSTSDERSPRTSPPRTGFAANVKFGEQVCQKFLGNGHNSLLPRTSSLLAN